MVELFPYRCGLFRLGSVLHSGTERMFLVLWSVFARWESVAVGIALLSTAFVP